MEMTSTTAIYNPLLTGIEAAGGRIEEIPVGMRVRNKNPEETAVKFSGANSQWFVNLQILYRH